MDTAVYVSDSRYLVLRYLSQYESSIEPIFGTLLVLGPGEHELNRGGEGGGDKNELAVVVAEAPLDTPAMVVFGPIVVVVTQQSFRVVRIVGVGARSSPSERRWSLPREVILLSGGGGSRICCKLLCGGSPSPNGGSVSMS